MSRSKKASAAGAAKPITDVAHPGTSAPSDTSKPIITHRPMIKDPMVVEKQADPELPAEEPERAQRTAEKTVEPPDKPPKAEKAESDEEPKKPAEESASAAEPAEEQQTDESAEEKPAGESEPEQPDDGKKKPAAAPDVDDKAAEAEDAKLQDLVDSKKYFLPINAVEQRRSKRVVIAGVILALILGVAWVDIALDAGLITMSGIKPVTHFFSN